MIHFSAIYSGWNNQEGKRVTGGLWPMTRSFTLTGEDQIAYEALERTLENAKTEQKRLKDLKLATRSPERRAASQAVKDAESALNLYRGNLQPTNNV